MEFQIVGDPLFYVMAVPAVLLTGISKSGFGSGPGGIAVPLMAVAISPVQAAAIMLPILCLMDILSLRAYRGKWDGANLRLMLPSALLGIATGSLVFGSMSDAGLRLLLGIIAVGFALNYLAGFSQNLAPRPASGGRALFWCGLSGFTSFMSHAGGPPMVAYLLPQKLDKTVFVGTSVVFFFFVNLAKLPPYAWLGQLNGDNLLTSLAIAPLVPLGVKLGLWLHGRMSNATFYNVSVTLLLLSGGKLIYDGVVRW